MLMGFGVEGRVPLLDHRVVEFGLSLPDPLKVGRRQGKLFLKRWAERFLPADHLYRAKRGFHVPVPDWLGGSFLRTLSDRLPRNPAIREWFRIDGVRRLLDAQRSTGKASREVWCLMQFAIWHRLFVEQPGSRPTPDEDPLDWIS
jgi:asparagine synthase (glutamine-hydrolysing)